MLRELKKQVSSFKFGDTNMYLRYDTNALCSLEALGVSYLTVSTADRKAVNALLFIGLGDYFDALGVENSERETITSDIISVSDINKLRTDIIGAILLALPKPVIGHKQNESETDLSFIKTAFCDIMGKKENEFWNSTLREIMERWEKYAVYMGYQKPVNEVEEFDDD